MESVEKTKQTYVQRKLYTPGVQNNSKNYVLCFIIFNIENLTLNSIPE